MNIRKETLFKLIWLSLFAVSMAYLESAIVVYLRELYYPDNILQIFPLRAFTTLDFLIELGREASTIIMILAASLLTGKRKPVKVFAAFCFVFGLWDIFYYIWLKIMIGWPVFWLEWDILFLIPWAWVGPWICPVFISIAFIMWGVYVLLSKGEIRFKLPQFLLFLSGCLLVLSSFLLPAFPLITGHMNDPSTIGTDNTESFLWPLFWAGYFFMTAGLTLTVFPLLSRLKKQQFTT
jgi:hypothetical protein